jgi:hypothetical protein
MSELKKRKRLSVDLSDNQLAELDEKKERLGFGKRATFIKTAIQVYCYLVDQVLLGKKIIVRDPETKEDQEVVFLDLTGRLKW